MNRKNIDNFNYLDFDKFRIVKIESYNLITSTTSFKKCFKVIGVSNLGSFPLYYDVKGSNEDNCITWINDNWVKGKVSKYRIGVDEKNKTLLDMFIWIDLSLVDELVVEKHIVSSGIVWSVAGVCDIGTLPLAQFEDTKGLSEQDSRKPIDKWISERWIK